MRSPFGLHPRMRLRRQRDFQRAYREGSRARGRLLVVVAVENELGWTRLGLAIGKKIWKGAVRRNRVRRIFREAFRLSRADLPVGVDLILMAAEPGLDPQLEETRSELVHLARKAHRRYLEKTAGGQQA